MYKQMLADKGYTGKLFTDVMPWFNRDNKHPSPGYFSEDPSTITNQVTAMKALGIEAVRVTYSGAGVSQLSHLATFFMFLECQRQGLLFCLMVNDSMVSNRPDKTISPENEVINRLSSPEVQYMLNADNYLPEKYVCEFGVKGLADLSKITPAFPAFTFLSKHTGFTWAEKASADGKITAAQNTLAAHKTDWARSPTPSMATLTPEFFDGSPNDLNKGIWDTTQKSTLIEPVSGNFFFDQLALVPTGCPYIGEVWNDNQERNRLEPRAAQFSGIRIA